MANETKTNKIVELEVKLLLPHPDNPRKTLGDITELAESIKQSGVMQNLTVVPLDADKYTVIIGHRRLAAAKAAGLETVPCAIVNLTPQEQIATMLFENMQRTDLTPREQAEGIQMMLDFGESIESVSQKTGLSESTVRRRVSLVKLNPKKMEAAAGNGATLEQFMKVSELKSKSAQNEVMDAIGTDNFNAILKRKLKEQKVAENMPKILKELGNYAIEDKNASPWNSGYKQVKKVEAEEWKPGDFKITPKKGKEYVWYKGWGDTIYLFIKEVKPQTVASNKLSEKELEVRRKNRQLKKVTKFAYELRSDFIKQFGAGKMNEDILYRWLLEICVCYKFDFSGNFNKNVCQQMIGQEYNMYSVDEELFKQFFDKKPSAALAMFVYCYSGDNEEQKYYSPGYGEHVPCHTKNKRLDIIYDYLCRLGYQMSDEEKQLKNGMHPLLQKGE